MRKARFLFFVGIVFLFATQANAAPITNWAYTITAQFTKATWEDTSETFPGSTSLSWGIGGTSSLVIGNSGITGNVKTYLGAGDPLSDNSYWAASIDLTHNNQPIDSDSNSLAAAILKVTVALDPTAPDLSALPSQFFTFNISFAETPNGTYYNNNGDIVPWWDSEAKLYPNDVFALPNGFPNFNMQLDLNGDGSISTDENYFVNVFPSSIALDGGPASVINTLQQLSGVYADLAGVDDGTLGFTTQEGHNTKVGFSFTISSNEIPDPAVPEPSTLLLLGFGLVGLAGIARRKLSK